MSNLQLEKQIITSILRDNKILDEFLKAGVTEDNFLDPKVKRLYAEMKKRREEERPIGNGVTLFHFCGIENPQVLISDMTFIFEETQDVIDILLKKSKKEKKKKEGVDKFFDGKKFIPKRLSDEIINKYPIKYYYNDFFVYDSGVYKPGGEKLIEVECEKILAEKVTNHRVREVIGSIKRSCHSEEPYYNTELINVKNGILNWKTGELLPHNPDEFNIIQLPVEYDPNAKCPKFEDYLLTALDPDVCYLAQEIMGYCLIPDTRFEKAVMLTGEGANGKGVFLDVLSYLLGEDNVLGTELQDLVENRFRAAELVGKLANISSDISNQSIENTGKFKMLVTGDGMQVERKHQQPFDFRNRAKLLFSCNEIPRSRDKTYAFYRRWLIIPFNNTFSEDNRDVNLREKLKKELPGILNLALEGLRRLTQNAKFSQPEQITSALDEYKKINDSVLSFIDENIGFDYGAVCVKQALYNAYKDWCEAQGLFAVSQKKMTISLKKLYPNVGEKRTEGGTGPWAWVNINLLQG